MKYLKNKYVIVLIVFLAGFLIGRTQGPERIEIKEKVVDQSELIEEMKSRIESLKKENLKENVRTVIVEKPDGTKITTKTRATEKSTSTAELSDNNKSTELKKKTTTETETKKIFSSNHNAVGIRPHYELFSTFDAEVYVRAGTKCSFLECYIQGSYMLVEKTPAVSVGLEYRF